MRARLAVFCSGFGSNFQALIGAVRRGSVPADIVLMVCDNPKAFALERARKAGIPVVLVPPKLFVSREAYEKVLVSVLKSQAVDLVVLAGFMRILTPVFVRAYRGRIVNVHPSYLPDFKGAHAIRDAFNAGVKSTGVSVHVVTEALDAGPVILQERIPVSRADTEKTLEERIHGVEHRLYPKAIGKYLKKLKRKGKK